MISHLEGNALYSDARLLKSFNDQIYYPRANAIRVRTLRTRGHTKFHRANPRSLRRVEVNLNA